MNLHHWALQSVLYETAIIVATLGQVGSSTAALIWIINIVYGAVLQKQLSMKYVPNLKKVFGKKTFLSYQYLPVKL